MGRISVRLDPHAERDLRRAAAARGVSVSDYVRSALRRAVEEGPRPTTLELLGDAVGKFDSAVTPPPTHPDELGDHLLDEHDRAARLRRARRHPRPARDPSIDGPRAHMSRREPGP